MNALRRISTKSRKFGKLCLKKAQPTKPKHDENPLVPDSEPQSSESSNSKTDIIVDRFTWNGQMR